MENHSCETCECWGTNNCYLFSPIATVEGMKIEVWWAVCRRILWWHMNMGVSFIVPQQLGRDDDRTCLRMHATVSDIFCTYQRFESFAFPTHCLLLTHSTSKTIKECSCSIYYLIFSIVFPPTSNVNSHRGTVNSTGVVGVYTNSWYFSIEMHLPW
jgi:hypothetical protein